MAQGIEFNFLANTRDVVKEAGTATDALEDVADALDNIGKSDGADDIEFRDVVRRANDAGDDIEDAFKDAAKRTERELEGIEGALREVEQTARTSGQRAGQSLDDGMTEGATRAKAEVAELKSEAVQNLSETASSFDGSFESIADGVQGTLGGIVSSLGPVGAAIGLAGAVGLGIVMTEIDKTKQKTQELRERVAELATEMIDAGSSDLGMSRQIDGLRDLVAETEEARTNINDVIRATDFADFDGLDIGPLARAMAGDLETVEAQLALVEDRLTGIQSVGYDNYDSELAAQQDRLEGIRDDLILVRDESAAAQEAWEAYVAAGGPELQARQEALDEYASSVQESLADAGASWEDFQDKETGAIDVGAYTAALEQRAAALEAYQGNVTRASQTLNQEALNYITSLGADAAPLLQAYIDAPLAEQQRLENVWATLGFAASDTYATQLQNNMPQSVEGPAVVLTIDDSAVRRYRPPVLPTATIPVQIARNGVPTLT